MRTADTARRALTSAAVLALLWGAFFLVPGFLALPSQLAESWKSALPGLANFPASLSIAPLLVLGRLGANLVSLTAMLASLGAILGFGLSFMKLAVPIRRRPAALPVLLGMAAGFGLEGLLLLGLGMTGLIRPAVVVPALIAGIYLLYSRRIIAATTLGQCLSFNAGIPVLSLAPVILVAAAALSAFAPDTSVDGLAWHLPYARLALRTGWLPVMPYNVIWQFPSIWELVLVPPFLLGGEAAARLMTSGVAVFTILLVVSGMPRGTGFGGRLAAILFASSTLATIFIPSCKNDIPAGMLSLASFLAALWALRARGSGPAVLAGILAGFALGTKYTTAMPAFASVAMLSLESKRGRNVRAFLLGAAVFFAPWGARGLILHNDPLYPVVSLQTGADFPAGFRGSFQRESHGSLLGEYSSFTARLRIPWTLAETEKIAILPALLVPAIALLWRSPAGIRWWALHPALAMVAWSMGPPQPRYLLSPLPEICGALELAPMALNSVPAGRTAFIALVAGTGALEFIRTWAIAPEKRLSEYAVAGGLLDPTLHRKAILSTWAQAADWANASLPPDAKPMFIAEVRAHPLERLFILPSVIEPMPLLEEARQAGNVRRFGVRIRQLGITHFIYNRTRAVYIRDRLAPSIPPLPALATWSRWFHGHARAIYSAPTVSIKEGSYYIYEIVPGIAREELNLPGVEGFLYQPEILDKTGDVTGARRTFDAVSQAVGPLATLDFARATIFEPYLPPAETKRLLENADRQGLRSVSLCLKLAQFAEKDGRKAEARAYLKRAHELDPEARF